MELGPHAEQVEFIENHLLMTAWPKSCSLAKGTWDPMWCWLQWSFKALAAGHHPGQNPWGKPLEKGSPFWELQGQPLHPHGYKGIIWCIIGGNEFGSNTLQVPHWNSHWPCWLCDCQNFPDSTASKSVKEMCLEKQDFYRYSQAEQLAEPYDHHLFGLPGVSCKMVRSTNCMSYSHMAFMATSWALASTMPVTLRDLERSAKSQQQKDLPSFLRKCR